MHLVWKDVCLVILLLLRWLAIHFVGVDMMLLLLILREDAMRRQWGESDGWIVLLVMVLLVLIGRLIPKEQIWCSIPLLLLLHMLLRKDILGRLLRNIVRLLEVLLHMVVIVRLLVALRLGVLLLVRKQCGSSSS